MSTELHALRQAWLALPEPDEGARANARARLREEIVREGSAGQILIAFLPSTARVWSWVRREHRARRSGAIA
jgi:hypothetical protein